MDSNIIRVYENIMFLSLVLGVFWRRVLLAAANCHLQVARVPGLARKHLSLAGREAEVRRKREPQKKRSLGRGVGEPRGREGGV